MFTKQVISTGWVSIVHLSTSEEFSSSTLCRYILSTRTPSPVFSITHCTHAYCFFLCKVVVGCLIVIVFPSRRDFTHKMFGKSGCGYAVLCCIAGIKMLWMLYGNMFEERCKYDLTAFVSNGFTRLKTG